MALRLMVGLGNPGAEYARTRHNVGFMFLDRLGGGLSWKAWKGGRAQWASGPDFLALKPLEFMNASGPVVREFSAFYKILPSELLVCYDDFALPFGTIRMRLKGSSGGHNGMDSVIQHLGTTEIPRLRVGIRPSQDAADPMDFVLKRFSDGESRELEERTFPRIEACIEDAVRSGFEHAMNLCNTPESAGEDR